MLDKKNEPRTFNKNVQNKQNNATNQKNQTETLFDITKTTKEIIPFSESEWNNKKAKLKKEYPKLTEADLAYEKGKHNELYKRVEARLDKTNLEVKSMINDIK